MTKKNPSKQSSKSHKKNKNRVGKQADAYRIFFAEQQTHRTELSSMSTKEQMKLLKAEWQKLSAQQKQAYKVKATDEINHQILDKKELTSDRIKSGTKTKLDNKHHSHGKSPSQKKTKRMNQKSATRKMTNHEQYNQIEAHETIENDHE
ncbi:unnamed protein product [Rotaria sp. Silwood1]|nr:unnamed protein product [Rotaria sp. Silwood1]CAF0931488.1 unnamed protein product [Rotaria sp. Silwood1]CAF3453651.1 unnamed protein product [Rotaria sp. Silwood1]CAF4607572.1 unnamed protein product [Rotaria sp. Silwood1]